MGWTTSYDDDDDDHDDDDDDDDDDDYDYDEDNDNYDAVDGYGNDPVVITDFELEVKNTQYTKEKRHVLSSHLQRIKADYLRERCKNKRIHTK